MITDLLDGAGIEVRTSPSKAQEIRICCPFCPERANPVDTRFLLGINLSTGWAYCFHCHWKSGNVRRTIRELCRVLGIPIADWTATGVQERPKPRTPTAKLEETGFPEGYEPFTNKPDDIERTARKYLAQRQISVSQIVRHKIGYAAVGPMAWRVIFPVVAANGKIYGSVGRTFAKQGKPKYLNTPNIKLLWGADKTGSTAVVVEGVIDALRVERALLGTRSMIAVARLGSSITPVQLRQLKQYERVIIFPDHDQAGIKGAAKLADACDKANIQCSVVVPDRMDDKDPGSMTDDEILTEVNSAQVWSIASRDRLTGSIGRREPSYPNYLSDSSKSSEARA